MGVGLVAFVLLGGFRIWGRSYSDEFRVGCLKWNWTSGGPMWL